MYSIPRFGTWSVPGQTQTQGTAIVQGVPPYPGEPGSAPQVYSLDEKNNPRWFRNPAYTHLTRLGITTGATAHLIYVLRPLNYTTLSATLAKNTTTFSITADPGIYSTNYKYPPAAGPSCVADTAVAANDYFAIQLNDGTWHFSKLASGTFGGANLTLSTATPNPTGTGGAASGNLVFWFGIGTDVVPYLNQTQFALEPNVSVYTDFGDAAGDGLVTSFWPGDPLLILDANSANADTLAYAAGFYGKV